MLIITADDLGRDRGTTDACLDCFRRKRITSASIMVFMKDSERAARLAVEEGLETGLHINLVQPYDEPGISESLRKSQIRTAAFFNRGPWTQVIYNPFIARAVNEVFCSQLEEYRRLFRCEPAYFNGHKHFHMSLNMILAGVLPRGSAVRRSFSFLPGEKTWINRVYRQLVDAQLLKERFSTDFFFSICPIGDLARLIRIFSLAVHRHVELMVHPGRSEESAFLAGQAFIKALDDVRMGSFESIKYDSSILHGLAEE